MLALCQPQLDLGASVLEIDLQRDDRVPLLAHSPVQAIDLSTMEQQLSRARLLMTELAGWCVCADVYTLQKRLAILDARIAVSEVRAMRPQRLDLRARQR